MWPQQVSASARLLGRSPTSSALCAYFKGRSYPSVEKKKTTEKPPKPKTNQQHNLFFASILLCVMGTRMLKCHVVDILVPVHPHENEITLEFCLLLSIRLLLSLFQSNFFLSCSSQCFARGAQNVLWMSPRNRLPGWWKLARLLQSQVILGDNNFGLLLKSLQVCKLLHEVV